MKKNIVKYPKFGCFGSVYLNGKLSAILNGCTVEDVFHYIYPFIVCGDGKGYRFDIHAPNGQRIGFVPVNFRLESDRKHQYAKLFSFMSENGMKETLQELTE